jgi:DNA-binding transcriptional regulator/RsmH inhibitor MraZ
MPTLYDVASEFHKTNFPSLFKAAILYSHFRLIFTLHFVYIALFVYPGKYFEAIADRLNFRPRKFAGLFSKGMY